MDTTKRECYKNLLILSSGWFLFFMSFASIRSMTSSVNHEEGIGLYSMASTYGGYMLTCCFTSGIVRIFTAKAVLVASLTFQILFVLANLSQSFYVIIPASVFGGVSQAAMWTAVGSYVMHLVIQVEQLPNMSAESFKSLKGRFFGVFFTFVSLAPVIGALITAFLLSMTQQRCLDTGQNNQLGNTNNSYSSGNANNTIGQLTNVSGQHLEQKRWQNCENVINEIRHVLHQENSTAVKEKKIIYRNYEICGPKFCHSSYERSEMKPVTEFTRLLLFGVYGACMLMAMFAYVFVLDSDGNDHTLSYLLNSKKRFRGLWSNVKSTFQLICSYKFLFLMPLITYHGLQTAFFSGEVTKAFPGCLYGLDYIGYFVMCFGISAAITSFISGFASGFVNRSFFLLMGGFINVFALVGMYLWDESLKDVLFVFSLAGLWGISEGIWTTHLNSLIGSAFPNKAEEGFSAFNLVLAFGLTIGYLYSNYVCMTLKILITGSMCIIGLVGYLLSRKIPTMTPIQEIQEVMISINNIIPVQEPDRNTRENDGRSPESDSLLNDNASVQDVSSTPEADDNTTQTSNL